MFKLNFPIETPQAKLFWASRHKSNRMKAIIAFSYNKENAIANLRRYGYPRGMRAKAWAAYGQYVRDPDMLTIPYSTLLNPWWLWQ